MDDRVKAARDELASKIVEACGFDWDGPVTWALVDAIDALIGARLEANSTTQGFPFRPGHWCLNCGADLSDSSPTAPAHQCY